MACSATCRVPVRFTQWIYFIGFVLSIIACWLLRDYGSSILNFSPLNKCLAETDPPNTACMGQEAVLRVTFGSFMFYALHVVALLGVTSKSNPRLMVHTGFWPLKFPLWAALIFSTFYMSNGALQGFGQAARVFSGVFIVLQLVIILEFVYTVNEWLLEREQYAWVLISGTSVMMVGSLVGVGVLYYFYVPQSSCSLNIWFITSTLLMFLVYGPISISPIRNQSAGLFTSAAVFTYTVYYAWSALISEPSSHSCSSSSAGASKTILVIGFVVAVLVLGYSTMSGGTSSHAFDLSTAEKDEDELPYRPDFFHLMFMLASCYSMMLFVGWELTPEGLESDLVIDMGWGSTWVKIIAAWLCGLLYTWSLVAHWVLRHRHFGA